MNYGTLYFKDYIKNVIVLKMLLARILFLWFKGSGFIPGKYFEKCFGLMIEYKGKMGLNIRLVISCEITHHSFVLFLKYFPRLRR